MSRLAETLVLALLVGITTQAAHYCGKESVKVPRCYQNQKEECKECPECWSFGGIWGTWHQVGVACKCDGLCYEGSPDWFTWEETARSKDYADPWAGAGPANFNSNKSVMPMQVPGAFLGGATRSPRKERLQNNRLAVLQVPTFMARWRIEELKKKNNKSASDHWGLGNPRMTNHHSNRRMIPPRIPGQSSQTAHVGMVRPRMGLANQNIKSNRMVNMHSRNMNPNLDYNSVMASSGQEAGSCWGCIGGLVLAAAGCWEDAVALPIFIACVAGAEGLVGCDMDACVCPWICGSSIYSAACNACHEFSGGTTAAPTPAPALTQVP